jgi:hypothetical protein
MTGAGAELARRYHAELVGPLLAERWPGLPYAAGRLGSGSDVLGLDDRMSADHDWGLRLTVLVEPGLVAALDDYLAERLPGEFAGLPTRFGVTWDPVARHRVEVSGVDDFVASRLGAGFSDHADPVDWLTLIGQSVLEVTAGPVFTDSHGRLTQVRSSLDWYPDDVWRYVVAAGWSRVAEELPMVGRTASRGDETGSRIIAGRLAHSVMHLGFLLERRWAPYPKWLGTLFADLPDAHRAGPALAQALAAQIWPDREEALCRAVEIVYGLHRRAGLPGPDGPLEPFWDRPFRGVRPAVSQAPLDAVADPDVRRLPAGIGSVEQWVDNPAVLASPRIRAATQAAYRAMMSGT